MWCIIKTLPFFYKLSGRKHSVTCDESRSGRLLLPAEICLPHGPQTWNTFYSHRQICCLQSLDTCMLNSDSRTLTSPLSDVSIYATWYGDGAQVTHDKHLCLLVRSVLAGGLHMFVAASLMWLRNRQDHIWLRYPVGTCEHSWWRAADGFNSRAERHDSGYLPECTSVSSPTFWVWS
jgi:hypothetical protein